MFSLPLVWPLIGRQHQFIETDIFDEFDEIGFIGGEFFDGQLSNPKVKDLFYRLFDKVVDLGE